MKYFPVSIQRDGKTIKGNYHLDGDKIIVSCDYGYTSAFLKGTPEYVLAALLLSELYNKSKEKIR